MSRPTPYRAARAAEGRTPRRRPRLEAAGLGLCVALAWLATTPAATAQLYRHVQTGKAVASYWGPPVSWIKIQDSVTGTLVYDTRDLASEHYWDPEPEGEPCEGRSYKALAPLEVVWESSSGGVWRAPAEGVSVSRCGSAEWCWMDDRRVVELSCPLSPDLDLMPTPIPESFTEVHERMLESIDEFVINPAHWTHFNSPDSIILVREQAFTVEALTPAEEILHIVNEVSRLSSQDELTDLEAAELSTYLQEAATMADSQNYQGAGRRLTKFMNKAKEFLEDPDATRLAARLDTVIQRIQDRMDELK